jgi:hypothetical protein
VARSAAMFAASTQPRLTAQVLRASSLPAACLKKCRRGFRRGVLVLSGRPGSRRASGPGTCRRGV